MARKNKYAKRSKLSERKFRKLVKLFAVDSDASQIGKITGLNRNTVSRYLKEIRTRIAQHCEKESRLSGEVGVDDNYLWCSPCQGPTGSWSIWKNHCLWRLQKKCQGLDGNRPKLQAHNPSGRYQRPGES